MRMERSIQLVMLLEIKHFFKSIVIIWDWFTVLIATSLVVVITISLTSSVDEE